MAEVDAVVAVVGDVVEVVGDAFVVRVCRRTFVLHGAPEEGGRACGGLQEDVGAALLLHHARENGGGVDKFAAAEDEDAFVCADVAGDEAVAEGNGAGDAEAAEAAVGDGNGAALRGGGMGGEGGGREMPCAFEQAVAGDAVCRGRAEVGEAEPVGVAQVGEFCRKGGGECAEGIAGGEFVVDEDEGLRAAHEGAVFGVGGQIQPLLCGMAVAFFKGADGGVGDA